MPRFLVILGATVLVGAWDGPLGGTLMGRFFVLAISATFLAQAPKVHAANVLNPNVQIIWWLVRDGTQNISFGVIGGLVNSVPGASVFAEAAITSHD